MINSGPQFKSMTAAFAAAASVVLDFNDGNFGGPTAWTAGSPAVWNSVGGDISTFLKLTTAAGAFNTIPNNAVVMGITANLVCSRTEAGGAEITDYEARLVRDGSIIAKVSSASLDPLPFRLLARPASAHWSAGPASRQYGDSDDIGGYPWRVGLDLAGTNTLGIALVLCEPNGGSASTATVNWAASTITVYYCIPAGPSFGGLGLTGPATTFRRFPTVPIQAMISFIDDQFLISFSRSLRSLPNEYWGFGDTYFSAGPPGWAGGSWPNESPASWPQPYYLPYHPPNLWFARPEVGSPTGLIYQTPDEIQAQEWLHTIRSHCGPNAMSPTQLGGLGIVPPAGTLSGSCTYTGSIKEFTDCDGFAVPAFRQLPGKLFDNTDVPNLTVNSGLSPGDNATGQSVNVDLAWNAVSGADYYDVWFGDDSTFDGHFRIPPLYARTPTNSLTLPPLAAATKYWWRVVTWKNGLKWSTSLKNFTTS